MPLTKIDDCRERLQQGYDPDYYESVFRQQNYAFGEPWNTDLGTVASEGGFPYFPDLTPKYQEPGRSRRILNAQFVGLSRMMAADPEPEFLELDAMLGETLKGWFKARYKGDGYTGGNWADEEHRAFMDGDSFGMGFLQLGLTRGKSGQLMVTARHSPALFTLGDRHERSPDRWRWVTFVHYVPADKAIKQFGSGIEKYIKPLYDGTQVHPLKAVRIFEYFDLGYGDSDPTRILIPHDWTEKPLKKEANTLGCLPFSYYIHFFAPGMRKPVGRVVLQMATQEALNEVEEAMRHNLLVGKGFDIASPDQYDEKDLRDLRSGKQVRLVKRTSPKADDWERVPAGEVSQTTIMYLQQLERQFGRDSGTTDFDMGVQPQNNRTLGENLLVDQRGQSAQAWSVRQAISFRERTVEKALKIAEYDAEPVAIDFYGSQVVLNNPDAPDSFMANIMLELGGPPHPIINEESMSYRDVKQRRLERLAYLQTLGPLVEMGLINPVWWAEEILKAGGEKDTRSALMMQPGAGMEMMNAGSIPGQGVQGAIQPGAPVSKGPGGIGSYRPPSVGENNPMGGGANRVLNPG